MAFDDIDPPAPSLQQQQIVSDKIKKLIEEYEEPDLAFVISNTETKTLEIPFEKKNETDLPKKKKLILILKLKVTKTFMCTIMSVILKNLDFCGKILESV